MKRSPTKKIVGFGGGAIVESVTCKVGTMPMLWADVPCRLSCWPTAVSVTFLAAFPATFTDDT